MQHDDHRTDDGPRASAPRDVVAAVAGRLLPSVAALSTTGPVHALACWQDSGHVTSLASLVDALGSLTTLTIAATGRPDLPADVEQCVLEASEPLALRWSLVALGVRGAVVLDAGPCPLPTASGADGGRDLTWTVSCDPRRAVVVARAQLRDLGARLGPERSAGLHGAVTALAAHAWPSGESRSAQDRGLAAA